MNRSRLMREVNDMRLALGKTLTEALGDWYIVKVTASNQHVADRILDRATTPEKGLSQVKQMLDELGKYYPCSILHFAQKSRTEGLQNVIAYKRVSPAQIFAIALTTKIIDAPEQEKPVMVVTLRTVVTDYTSSLKDKNTINVAYKAPKIAFEYDGFRRTLSRLTRLVQSDECPDSLKVLRM